MLTITELKSVLWLMATISLNLFLRLQARPKFVENRELRRWVRWQRQVIVLHRLRVELLHVSEENCPKKRSHGDERNSISFLDEGEVDDLHERPEAERD